MPQGKGTAQWRSARPGTCDGLPRGGLHFGANLSSGAPSDARVFAALFLLPEYRWPAANRTFPGTAGRPTNRRRHGVCRSSFATIMRSEEHTSELQSLMRISSAVFCLKKKTITLL